MRLSTHLGSEALAKLTALKSEQKQPEKKDTPRTSPGSSIIDLMRVIPRPASENPRSHIPLKQARKELGLSYTEIREQAAISNLPTFEYRTEKFLKKYDVEQLRKLMT